MEANGYLQVLGALWLVWGISWVLAAWWNDRAVARAPRSSWRWHIWLAAAGFVLIGLRLPGSIRLWPVGPMLGWSMIAVTALALVFAWWARITMGKLWSGGVMRTDQHRVIESGPFAWVRHPIYSALIAGGIALAAVRATPAALAGAALVALGFYLKARVEENFLTRELEGYPEYRSRVSMLVPRPPRHQSERLS